MDGLIAHRVLTYHLNVFVDHELAEESFEGLRWLKYDVNFDKNWADLIFSFGRIWYFE